MKKRYFFKIIEKAILLIFPVILFLLIYEKPFINNDISDKNTSLVQKKEISEKIKQLSLQNRYGTLFDKEITDFIIYKINNAKKEIRGVTYTFSNRQIAKALKKADKRGVKISLFYGKKSNLKKNNGLYLRTMNRGILHEKFLIIDDIVIISSANLSSHKSSNSAIWFKNVPKLKKILEKEIKDLFAPVYNKKCQRGCSFEYGKIYFSPGKSCSSIKKEILKGKKEIFLALYTVTIKNPMMSGIKKQLTKKIKITSIVDNWSFENKTPVNKRVCRYIKVRNGKCRMWDEKRQKRKFHHKFALIDDKKLIFGSMNWTASGCYKNREITIVTENKKIVSNFVKYKKRLTKAVNL